MNGTVLGQELIELVAQQAPWVALAIARPFGFTIVFYAFAWGHLNSGVLRMAFAFAIAAPSIASGFPADPVETLETAYLLLLLKEVFFGILIGLIASAPLAVAVGAGGIIDIYRGASLGNPDLGGGEATPVANTLVVISLWIFAAVGGFWMVARLLYESYVIWPAVEPLPAFSADMGTLWRFAGTIVMSAVILSGPMLALMFFSDIAHLISVKFGKQINVSHMAFSTKNILLAAALPVYLVFAYQSLRATHGDMAQTLNVLQAFFR